MKDNCAKCGFRTNPIKGITASIQVRRAGTSTTCKLFTSTFKDFYKALMKSDVPLNETQIEDELMDVLEHPIRVQYNLTHSQNPPTCTYLMPID